MLVFTRNSSKKKKCDDNFVALAEGVEESALIVSAHLEPLLKKLTAKEEVVQKFHNLHSIHIRLHPDTAYIPGMYYPFFQVLAWRGINFIEIFSGFSELTFLFADTEVDKAFQAIRSVV